MRFTFVLLSMALVSGCATHVEKTSPCKRPANLTSYVEPTNCGPATLVNTESQQAIINSIGTPN